MISVLSYSIHKLIIDAAIGVLQVTIYTARGIRNPDKFSGTPDPYVVLSINSGRELARTEIQPSTTTPRWNETKTLLINSLNDALSFQIFDYNEIRKDRLLGTANFDLKQLEEDAEHENVNGQVMYNAKSRGEVNFDIRYYPVLKPKKLQDGTEQAPPDTTTGIVAFTIHQAKDLDAHKSLVGTLSPYAVFLLNGKEVHISKKLKRTNNPIWDEHVEMLVHNRMNCRLGVVIKDDRDISVDPIVGSYQIRLNDFLERMEAQQDWFTLAGASTGKVRMEVKWKPVIMPGGMQGSSGYITPIGVMRFHFKQARDVRNVEAVTGGKSDPYVRYGVKYHESPDHAHQQRFKPCLGRNPLCSGPSQQRAVRTRSNGSPIERQRSKSLDTPKSAQVRWFIKMSSANMWNLSILKRTLNHFSMTRRRLKAHYPYSVSFYPCLNVADPEEEEELQNDQAKIQEIPDGPSNATPNLSENTTKPSPRVKETTTNASSKLEQTVNGAQSGSPQLRSRIHRREKLTNLPPPSTRLPKRRNLPKSTSPLRSWSNPSLAF